MHISKFKQEKVEKNSSSLPESKVHICDSGAMLLPLSYIGTWIKIHLHYDLPTNIILLSNYEIGTKMLPSKFYMQEFNFITNWIFSNLL